MWKTTVLLILCCCFLINICDGLSSGPGVCTERRKNYRANRNKAREYLVCCSKYEYVLELDICKPICSLGCDGGRCVSPDECQCDPPLILNDMKNKCIEPACEPQCVNALCRNINECHCNPDHIPYNSTHCAPNCPDGYKINEETFDTCLPKCSKPCTNGVCSAPEQCSCFEGYELSLNDTYKCVHTCNPKCVNADCVGHNKCECHEGYENVDGICKAKCHSCEFGECISPDTCICEPGYERKSNSCVPQCQIECSHGFCYEPNKCECQHGYKNVDGICKMDCQLSNSCTPEEQVGCKACNGKCSDGSCYCSDRRPCFMEPEMPAEVQSPKMAGLEVTWLVGGCVGFLMLILIIVVTRRLWKRKDKVQAKTEDDKHYASVVYTVPETQINNMDHIEETDFNEKL